MRSDDSTKLLTAAEVAAWLNCSIKIVREHVRAGDLPFIAIGRGDKRPRMRFDPRDVQRLIDLRKTTRIPPMPRGNYSRSSPKPASTIVDFTKLERPSAKRRRQ